MPSSDQINFSASAAQEARCPKQIERQPEKYRNAKPKMVFYSRKAAKAKAKRNDFKGSQRPYLCTYCSCWHLGKMKNIKDVVRDFIIPVREELEVCTYVVVDSPLIKEIEKIYMQPYSPKSESEYNAINGLISRFGNNFSVSDLMVFSTKPSTKAVVWALNVPPSQPVFLKDGENIEYRKDTSTYWLSPI